MNKIVLAPAEAVPLAEWNIAPNEPIAAEPVANIEITQKLADLAKQYQLSIVLSPHSLCNVDWSTIPLLQNVSEARYPLRNIISAAEVEGCDILTKSWLTYWEVFAQTIIPSITQKLTNKREATYAQARAKGKTYMPAMRSTSIRTYHIADNSSTVHHVMKTALGQIELASQSSTTWDWNATYTNTATKAELLNIIKDTDRWIMGVDGQGHPTTANLRAWKNRISASLKRLDIVVDASGPGPARDKVAIIVFVLINLAADGCAIVELENLAHDGLTSAIHLFAQHFQRAELIHVKSEDRIFLCGTNFHGKVGVKRHPILYKFAEVNIPLFSATYRAARSYQNTVGSLAIMIGVITEWRYQQYDYMLNYYKFLQNTYADSNNVGKELSEIFKDESCDWIQKMNFTSLSV